ncbi:MAG: hypothetical protein ACRYHQ_01770 [Janthinobacterium lividum]
MTKIAGSPFAVFARRVGRAPIPTVPAPRPGAATGESADGPLCAACAEPVEPAWKFCASCGQDLSQKPDPDEEDEDDDDEDDDSDGELAAVRRRATARCEAIYDAGVRLGIPGAAVQVLGTTTLGRKSAIRLLETMVAKPGAQLDAAARGKVAAQFVLDAARQAGIVPTPPAANDPLRRR